MKLTAKITGTWFKEETVIDGGAERSEVTYYDSIAIFDEDDDEVADTSVESCEDPDPYDVAVKEAIREEFGKDLPFTWES
ncbi:hypothetical protein [Corynebacterium ulcerans]|uniref:hypothetical protein n=1 Tax=Corynebacterium ulcerans TaxID=65058 RepID=UPI0018D64943|nr:hypothetical protein [Corynebacterium ulcerans]MBH5296176.1 hypothetical protein [Corynebacterium ulcerans]